MLTLLKHQPLGPALSALPRVIKLQKQLTDMGGDVAEGRGKMLHLILVLCQKVQKAFDKCVDGGSGGKRLAWD